MDWRGRPRLRLRSGFPSFGTPTEIPPAGASAAFNTNILVRANGELGANFDLAAFRHRAVYNEEAGRIEMYLVNNQSQSVRIDALELVVPFAAEEAIHTENSYKYSFAEIDALAAAAGLRQEGRWLDAAGAFSVNLLAPD